MTNILDFKQPTFRWSTSLIQDAISSLDGGIAVFN
jgi:hypothetical protein